MEDDPLSALLKKLPPWAIFCGSIALASILIVGMNYITRSPAEQALDDCISDLNKSASGGLSRSDLEELCVRMQQRQLEQRQQQAQ